ncbi:ABC transporter substrate-binding protein [Auritidibacter ignavus]|uniref:ABC transporter substrate-binding protein n=1 Tax=Auritidibacter ignavus TaxID=678932 RepID=UPI000F032E6B|nr:ABC transporter substrate-binding protein [Auritidibacter ignavus]WGH88860.1 ABC transporter substrate-binding protein [Auritidibacter ignavus]WGH91163.1 ABC transporter substrate-binding protein [Auritidibacter ignavus]WHS34990.1 ABC transporter substrate-binding protein [Auritidibacter ignavus]
MVVLGGSAEDAVAALGVVPVAVPEEYGTPDGYTDWFRKHVTVELGAELPPVLSPGKDGVYDPEEILSYAPDLIFAPYSGITESDYQQLSDIAPTIAYAHTPWTYGSWSDIVELAGNGRFSARCAPSAQREDLHLRRVAGRRFHGPCRLLAG